MPSINPAVGKGPLILFDRTRACNLIVCVTNDPFVDGGGRIGTDVYYYYNRRVSDACESYCCPGNYSARSRSPLYNYYNIGGGGPSKSARRLASRRHHANGNTIDDSDDVTDNGLKEDVPIANNTVRKKKIFFKIFYRRFRRLTAKL